MSAPEGPVETLCPQCGRETPHEVLRGRPAGRGLQGTFRCGACGRVHPGKVTLPELRTLPVILSRDAASARTQAALRSDEEVALRDQLVVDGTRVEVSGIELSGAARVPVALVADVATLWVRAIDTVTVRFVVNEGAMTRAVEEQFPPEETFTVGESLEVDGRPVLVRTIKTRDGNLRRGSAPALEIVRLVCQPLYPVPRPTGRPGAPPLAARASAERRAKGGGGPHTSRRSSRPGPGPPRRAPGSTRPGRRSDRAAGPGGPSPGARRRPPSRDDAGPRAPSRSATPCRRGPAGGPERGAGAASRRKGRRPGR